MIVVFMVSFQVTKLGVTFVDAGGGVTIDMVVRGLDQFENR